MQNDLEEFHAMVDFVNPGLLFDLTKFKNVFQSPILESRERDAEEDVRLLGAARSKQVYTTYQSPIK